MVTVKSKRRESVKLNGHVKAWTVTGKWALPTPNNAPRYMFPKSWGVLAVTDAAVLN
ncbi:hypothetical protein COLO4_12863 [Corchorus olitorius]|uniref:Uncharacterized protein n=1 Tax=Corchorus olitorius TaxID=93759 RepID=A0A1R3JZD6_9ROSI|nr:hypothetical protein COLO4_12863 [Corchorus olitorius]